MYLSIYSIWLVLLIGLILPGNRYRFLCARWYQFT